MANGGPLFGVGSQSVRQSEEAEWLAGLTSDWALYARVSRCLAQGRPPSRRLLADADGQVLLAPHLHTRLRPPAHRAPGHQALFRPPSRNDHVKNGEPTRPPRHTTASHQPRNTLFGPPPRRTTPHSGISQDKMLDFHTPLLGSWSSTPRSCP